MLYYVPWWFRTRDYYSFTILEARLLKSRWQQGCAPTKGSEEYPLSAFGGLQAELEAVELYAPFSLGHLLFCNKRTMGMGFFPPP